MILRENARRRHRPRRQAARGRRAGQADRRPGDGARARRPDAAHRGRARRARRRAGDSTRRHVGHWRIKGVADPIELFERPASRRRRARAAGRRREGHRVVSSRRRWLPVKRSPNNLPPTGDVVRRPRARARRGAGAARDLAPPDACSAPAGSARRGSRCEVAARALRRLPRRRLARRAGAARATRRSSRRRSRRRSACARRPARSLDATPGDASAARRALLVLDNCEHLLERLRRARRARSCGLPATCASWPPAASRCGVAGEVAWPRAAAARCPEPGDDVAGAAPIDAVRAVRRAGAPRSPASRSTTRTRPRSPRSAARLDGIPLALELAAARVRVALGRADRRAARRPLPAADAAAAATALPRQQTLRATIDWSYDLLDRARAGAAAGGWPSSPAAGRSRRPRRSARGDRSTPTDVLDLLAAPGRQVARASVDERGDEARYRLLETIRAVRRRAAARARARTRRCATRHARLVPRRWPRRAEPSSAGREQRRGSTRLDGRARQPARRRWRGVADAGDGEASCGSRPRWGGSGSCAATCARAAAARRLALAAAPTGADARAHGAARSARWLARFTSGACGGARALDERSLAIRTPHRRPAGEAARARTWGMARASRRPGRRRPLLRRALGLLRAGCRAAGRIAARPGQHPSLRGGDDRAGGMLEESLAIKRGIGDRRGIAMTLDNLADFAATARRRRARRPPPRGEPRDPARVSATPKASSAASSASPSSRSSAATSSARARYTPKASRSRATTATVSRCCTPSSRSPASPRPKATRRARRRSRGHADWLRAEIGYALRASSSRDARACSP